MDNNYNCLVKKLPSDNTIILQIGHNTYAGDWKFDPLTLSFFSTPRHGQYPFIGPWHWEELCLFSSYSIQLECKSTISSYNRSKESLILQKFDPELLFWMFTFPSVSIPLFSRANDAEAGWIFYNLIWYCTNNRQYESFRSCGYGSFFFRL